MSAPPTGTITFLFTDIEGSTQRWEQFPVAMALAVAAHDALLRSVIENHGGTVFKTIGDAFCAAFSVASQGVQAALEGQRAIERQEWGDLPPLRVRMALHTGVAQERDSDYFGPTLNRVARILSVGHGGQTLLSETTRQLVQGDALGNGALGEAEFQDLGIHRLKDLAQSEQIFGLIAPGVQTDFPPLRSLNRQAHNLPIPPTSLIGREEEVAQVLVLLRDPSVRLVTLSGPGGTGKTRLSLEIAERSLAIFPEGAYFVSLVNTTSAEEIVAAIRQVLALKETADAAPLEGLTRFLRPLNALLVLDNFEQVTASATMVADLLAACPHLKFLITSQSVLKLRGERGFGVQPLAVPPKKLPPLHEIARFPAIELFVSRAQTAKPGFELTAENAAAVAEICRRLDGLPLALELAAARVKLLAPQAMLGHLQNRLKLLTGGARDLPQRQRTLRDAIAWSHDLLEEEEKVLLRRLAIFQDGFTLEAALAVGEAPEGAETDVFNGVEALVDKSLLRHQEAGEEIRFAMLENIREFGLEQLKLNGELPSTATRHAEFFSGWMEDLAEEAKTNPSSSLEPCEVEHENLRAALDWWLDHAADRACDLAIALSVYWERQGHFREAREKLARCLDVIEAGQNLVRQAELLELSGWFLILVADYEAARGFQERRLELSRSTGDVDLQANALNDLALTDQALGEKEKARAGFEESLVLVRQSGEPRRIAGRLSNLALLAIEQERFDEARQTLTEASTLYEKTGDLVGTAACLCNLGELELRRANFSEAQSLSQRSLTLFRDLKDQRGIAFALSNLAEAQLGNGALEYAIPALEEALTIAGDAEMQWLIPNLLENLSRSYAASGAPQRALQASIAATTFRTSSGAARSVDEEETWSAHEATLEAEIGEKAVELRRSFSKMNGEATIVQIVAPRHET